MIADVEHLLTAKSQDLAEACETFGVARLALFGSATTAAFDPVKSDLDFIVEFKPEARVQAFDNYFGLRERLQAMFERPIDLVTWRSLRNHFLIREIEQSQRLLYASHA